MATEVTKFVPLPTKRRVSKYEATIVSLLSKGRAVRPTPPGENQADESHRVYITVRAVLERCLAGEKFNLSATQGLLEGKPCTLFTLQRGASKPKPKGKKPVNPKKLVRRSSK